MGARVGRNGGPRSQGGVSPRSHAKEKEAMVNIPVDRERLATFCGGFLSKQ